MRNFLDDSIAEHKSKPPLRWIANWAGSIASHGLLEVSYMEDEGLTNSFRYKLYGWLWDTFWPLYRDYGTTYRLRMDLSGPAWDDYDADGIPYWEKTGTVDPEYSDPNYYGWSYDPETGDSWRIKK